MAEDAAAALALLCRAEGDVDVAEGALLLGALDRPGFVLDRYRHHLSRLIADAATRHKALLDAGAQNDLETRLAALKHAIVDIHGYAPDDETPSHIQNSDLLRVIDRGKGGAAALSIIYVAVARGQGWDASGVDLPGHCAVRLDREGQRLMFDPAAGCAVLQAPDLRRLVKRALGAGAELSTEHYRPLTARTLLVKLQNAIKLKQVEAGDYESALRSVEAMRLLDPDEYRLLLDEGVLCARTGRPGKAMAALDAYIARAPDQRDRREAAVLLQQIRSTVY